VKKPSTSVSPEKLLFSRPEAALALGLSVRKIDYLISSGTIRVKRIGGRVLIHGRTLRAFAALDPPLEGASTCIAWTDKNL
jgi:excisionase family DNA binding protein